jgi:hypothetical protein
MKRQSRTHFEKAFDISVKLLDTEAKRDKATLPGLKATHARTARKLEAKLEALTSRDRPITKLLAEYLRQHGELTTIADFIAWAEQHGRLPYWEEPKIRAQLHKHFGARGERGRKPNKT